MTTDSIKIPAPILQAITASAPVVALESTVIAHGLPRPLNLETARDCERAVTEAGALPATIGIVAGVPTAGINEAELEAFAGVVTNEHQVVQEIAKVGLNNLAGVIRQRQWGATTVAATMRIAQLAGIRVFATGGIGGVHRGAGESFDISADLTALAQIPIVCVCAGAKAILDLPKTLEYLETLGVPVIGFQTAEFPAFYSRQSGLPVDVVVDSAEEAAGVAMTHWQTGSTSAVLLCAPIPEVFQIAAEEIERAVDEAMTMAERSGVRGKAVTPFLLEKMKEITAGRTLEANRALLVNNASIAAQIAVSLSKLHSA